MTNPITDIFVGPQTLEQIAQALEAGTIYNADFQDLKGTVNRGLGKAWYQMVDQVYLNDPTRHTAGGRHNPDFPVELHGLYGAAPQIHTIKSAEKKVAKAEKAHPEHNLTAAGRLVLNAIKDLVADMNTLKGTVIKARKPRTEPLMTPARTLDNTGTCSVCSRNVKLNEGKIWAHGYSIRWGFQSGTCYGTGYDPIEISSEGLVAWIERLNTALDDTTGTLDALVNGALVKNPSKIKKAEMNIRYIKADLKVAMASLEAWVARPLQG